MEKDTDGPSIVSALVFTPKGIPILCSAFIPPCLHVEHIGRLVASLRLLCGRNPHTLMELKNWVVTMCHRAVGTVALVLSATATDEQKACARVKSVQIARGLEIHFGAPLRKICAEEDIAFAHGMDTFTITSALERDLRKDEAGTLPLLLSFQKEFVHPLLRTLDLPSQWLYSLLKCNGVQGAGFLQHCQALLWKGDVSQDNAITKQCLNDCECMVVGGEEEDVERVMKRIIEEIDHCPPPSRWRIAPPPTAPIEAAPRRRRKKKKIKKTRKTVRVPRGRAPQQAPRRRKKRMMMTV